MAGQGVSESNEPTSVTTDVTPAAPASTHLTTGLLYALAAYGWWGFVPPLYFKALAHVDPLEILAHRIIWSVFLLGGLVLACRHGPELLRCFRYWPHLRLLILSTILISVNWFVYIYGVVSSQIIQTSLGYFINPMVNVVLGMLIFHEKLRGLQWAAVALAAVGVVTLTVGAGQLPWIALTLAISFGLYGMIRKLLPVDGQVSLLVEILLVLPIALAYLGYRAARGETDFAAHDALTDWLLIIGSVVTVVPLVCFGQAARCLPLSTLGFMQFLSPTVQFLVAVFVFREEVTPIRLLCFGCIWLGLTVFTFDSAWQYRARRLAQ